MASKETRKRKMSDASQSMATSGSQDSVSMDLGTLNVNSQPADSAPEIFKKPRTSIRSKEIPSETMASKKLIYKKESFIPTSSEEMKIQIEGYSYNQSVRPLCGNYIVDLSAMILSLSEVASCILCNGGVMELFEMACRGTCASKLLFRCNKCYNSKIFMNVGEINSDSTNSLDTSTVLAGRIAGLNSEKTRTYHAGLNLQTPPTSYCLIKLQDKVIAAAEDEAIASMERATKQLKSMMGIDPTTKCVHASASLDGAYHFSSCFSSIVSTEIGKVLAYDVISNSCRICTRYENKYNKNSISEIDQEKWDAHKEICPVLEYSQYANIHLESAIAPKLIEHAHKRGIIFPELVCDGDNNAVESLNTSDIYQKLGINMNISKIECLSHVMRTMMNNLIGNPFAAGKCSMEEASVESYPKEIKYMTRAISGRVSHLYRLALEFNEGNPTRAKAEIDAIPFHLGANDNNASENHRFCPCLKNTWCDYQKAIFYKSPVPHHPDYLSNALVDFIGQTFSKYKYNDEEFIQTLIFGMTTNHNESIHHVLFDMVSKKERTGLKVMKLGAALAVIRYNDGFDAVYNIFQNFSQSVPLKRTKGISSA